MPKNSKGPKANGIHEDSKAVASVAEPVLPPLPTVEDVGDIEVGLVRDFEGSILGISL